MPDSRPKKIEPSDVPFLGVKGASNGRFYVTLRGEIITGKYPSKFLAERGADRIAAASRHTRRNCISCNRRFTSQGPHNRMCDSCRQHRSEVGAQWEAF